MRVSSLFLVVGVVALGSSFVSVGCSSDSGTGSSSSSASSSGGESSSSGTSSSGNTGSSSGGSGSSGSSGSSGAGGAPAQTCGECTSGSETGACKSQKVACDGDADCSKIYACVYGLDGSAGCSTDHAGGCCTLGCFTSTGASAAAITKYKAFDSCVYCTTCKAACSAPPYDPVEYCKITQGNGTCP